MDVEQLKKIIGEGLPCEGLYVDNEGEYFDAIIVSSQFEGKTRVQRQQLVNALLKSYFDSGELHALSMKTMTPDELEVLRRG